MDYLQEQDWLGNVRELQNAVERAVIMSGNGGTLDAVSFGLNSSRHSDQVALEDNDHLYSVSARIKELERVRSTARADEVVSLVEIEKAQILRALKVTRGNRTHAAKLLKVNVRTLRNKLNLYRLDGVTIPDSQGKGGRRFHLFLLSIV